MTKVKEQAIGLLQSIPDDKVVYIIDILHGLKGLSDYDAKEQDITVQNHSAMGIFNKYANVDLVPLEKGAWSKAVRDKHVNS